MKKALVFGGGGAKGSYEIGVWKALNKLHMKFDIVCGASIGSINGALYVLGKYNLAKRMWKTIKTTDLFDFDIGGDIKDLDYKGLLKEIVTKGGMSFDKATGYLNNLIDERKLRSSKIDYGLITVSLTHKKPRMLTKAEIPYGKLVDYISASCICYPFIAKKDIDGESFIDGGFYDNLPINLAIDMGADEVVAVNLSAIGLSKQVKNKDVNVTYIKLKDAKLFTLSFSKEYALRNMRLGYNDTMKTFKKLDGDIYTFKQGDLERNYKNIENSYLSLIKDVLMNNKSVLEIFKVSKYKKLFNSITNKKNINQEVNEVIEYLGQIFELDTSKIYNIDIYNKKLIRNIDELSYIKINKNLTGKFLISYIYNKYKNEDLNKIKKELYNIALLFPKEFLSATYLICLVNKYSFVYETEELYKEIRKVFNLR